MTDRIALTPQEAADAAGVPKRIIAEAYQSGVLKAHWRSERRPTILVRDLEAWIASWPTESESA
jgi:hypothetical protein